MSQNLGSLPPLVIQCHTSSTPSAPLTCDVIYGWPLNTNARRSTHSPHPYLISRFSSKRPDIWHLGQMAVGWEGGCGWRLFGLSIWLLIIKITKPILSMSLLFFHLSSFGYVHYVIIVRIQHRLKLISG